MKNKNKYEAIKIGPKKIKCLKEWLNLSEDDQVKECPFSNYHKRSKTVAGFARHNCFAICGELFPKIIKERAIPGITGYRSYECPCFLYRVSAVKEKVTEFIKEKEK